MVKFPALIQALRKSRKDNNMQKQNEVESKLTTSPLFFLSLFVLSLFFFFKEWKRKNNANHSLHWKYSEIAKKERKMNV